MQAIYLMLDEYYYTNQKSELVPYNCFSCMVGVTQLNSKGEVLIMNKWHYKHYM